VDAVANAVRPPLPKKLRDPANPRVPGWIEAIATQDDRVDHLLGSEPLDRKLNPRILPLTEHYSGTPAGSPVQELIAEAHE
jgi:hypothetical protein